MPTVYLSIGSNIEAEKHIRFALTSLQLHYGSIEVSRIYESVSVGFSGENFLNLVVALSTDIDLHELAIQLRDLEAQCGRQRHVPGGYDSRTLDIDILLYGELTGDFNGIRLPRKEIANRGFVIYPLADLRPDWSCPALFEGTLEEYRHRFDCGEHPLWPVNFAWMGAFQH